MEEGDNPGCLQWLNDVRGTFQWVRGTIQNEGIQSRGDITREDINRKKL